MSWIIFFLHITRDNTTVSLSYVYGLIVDRRHCAEKKIASCKPRNKSCGARGNNVWARPSMRIGAGPK